MRKNNIKNIIISSVHRDIIKWLQPDWIFDTDSLNLIDVDMENNRKRVAKMKLNNLKLKSLFMRYLVMLKLLIGIGSKNTTISAKV